MGLQNNLEAQIRTVNSWVKQEELSRTQLEVNMRMEIARLTEQLKGDIETFKVQQN